MDKLQLFEGRKIRSVWDEEREDWFFSVADVVEALTDSVNPSDYIKKMKKRDTELSKGWGQIVTPPFHDHCRRCSESQLCRFVRCIQNNTIYSVPERRTFQAMDC